MILVAEDLAPSETVQLEKDKILAFVIVRGSLNSHTAILARTMGIPALVGTSMPLEETLDGKLAAVDGNQGCFYVEPNDETLRVMEEKAAKERENRELLMALKGKESISLDGKKVLTYANIGNSKDLAVVLQNDAEGIGLFRSEFLYLEKNTYPTEEEQFKVYKMVAETMAGRRVIIRTLDIGADKQADYFELAKEENPAMGCRAIRICLTRPEIFKTQLRALFRASAYGKLAVMYPMITSVKEVRKIKEIVEEVKAELKEAEIDYGEVEQGIMIETPAAAIISDLLAIDRQNEKLDEFYNPHHKAVLRMIYQTVQNAHREGIWCGICGELGADPELTKLFLAMGIDELSVSPRRILSIRKIIRETDGEKEGKELLEKWL